MSLLQFTLYTCLHLCLAFTLFIATTLSSNTVSALTLYKWIDADGKVSYQDSPPPSGHLFEKKIIQQATLKKTPAATNDSTIKEPIEFYFSSECSKCDEVRAILQANNVPFIQNLIDYNPKKKQALIELTGSDAVPILTIGGKTIPELDQSNLEIALRNGGYPEP